MADNTLDLTIAVKAQTEQLKQLIGEVRNLVGGLKNTEAESDKAGAAFERFVKIASDITQAVTGVKDLAVGLKDNAIAAVELVKSVADVDRLYKNLSQTFGASKEVVAAFEAQFQKLGESVGSSRGFLSQFASFLGDSLKDPAGDSAQALAKLGVNLDIVRNASRPFDEALKQVAATTKGVTLTLEQARAAALAFGEDDASKVIPVLNDLAGAIDEVKSKGLLLDEEQSAQAEEVERKFGNLLTTISGLSTQILAEFLPALDKSLEKIFALGEGLSKDEDFVKGFNALKGVAVTVAEKDLPSVLEGLGRIVATIGQLGDKLLFIGEAIRGIPTAGIATLEETLQTATLASDKLKVAISENNRFLKILNESSSREEAQQKATALAVQLHGEQIEASSKKLQENTVATRENLTEQINQIGSIKELIAALKELRDNQKSNFEQAQIAAEREILGIKKQQIEAEQEVTDAIKAANQERLADALATGEALNLLPQEQVNKQQEAADKISEINQNLARLQIKNADEVIAKLNEEKEERIKQVDELVKKIFESEEDLRKAKQQTQAVIAGFGQVSKAIDAEILAAQRQKVDGEKKLAKETEDAEKRKQTAKIQTQKIADASLDLEVAKIDLLIAKKKEEGATEQEIAKLTLQKITIQIDAIQQKINQLEQEKEKTEELKQAQAELIKLEIERIGLSAKASNKVVDGKKQEAKATQEAAKAIETEAERIQGLADRAKNASGNLAAIGEVATRIAQEFQVQFDPVNDAIEKGTEELNFFREGLQRINDQILREGTSPFRELRRQLAELGIEELERKLIEANRRATIEAAQAAAKARTEQEIELVGDLQEINEEYQQKLEELEKERREAIRKFREELKKENDEYLDDVFEATKAANDDLNRIDEELAKRLKERDEKEKADAIKREKDLARQKEEIVNAAADAILAKLQDANARRAELEKELKEAEARALDDPDRARAIEEAQKKLANFDKKEEERQKREAQKQAELAKAKEESKSKAEFDARKDAIERKFELEEESAERIAEFEEQNNQAAIEREKDLNRQRQALLEQALQAKLQEIEEAAKEEEAQRARERQAIIDDFDQKKKDRDAAFQKQLSDLAKQHQDRIKQLNQQLKDERAAFKAQRDQLEQDTKEALDKIAASFGIGTAAAQAFFDAIKKGIADNKAALAAIAGAIGQAGQGSSDGTSTGTTSDGQNSTSSTTNSDSNSSSSSGSSDPFGNPNTASGDSSVGGPAGDNNNTVSTFSRDNNTTTSNLSKLPGLGSGSADNGAGLPSGSATSVDGYRKLMLGLFAAYKPGKLKAPSLKDISEKMRIATYDFAVALKIARDKSDVPTVVLTALVAAETALSFKGASKSADSDFAAAVEAIINIALAQPTIEREGAGAGAGAGTGSGQTPPPPTKDKETPGSRGKSKNVDQTGRLNTTVASNVPGSKANIGRGDTQFEGEAAEQLRQQQAGNFRPSSPSANVNLPVTNNLSIVVQTIDKNQILNDLFQLLTTNLLPMLDKAQSAADRQRLGPDAFV